MKSTRTFRLLPVVLVATVCLVGLKVAGLVLEGGYIFSARDGAKERPVSWAQQMLNFPQAGRPSTIDAADVTGSVEAKKEDKKAEGKDTPPKIEKIVDQNTTAEQGKPISASERAILERLQERRQELEARAREIDIRENLLKAAEKRVESKVEELKAVEARLASTGEQKSQQDLQKFKGIVTMYETMKPKDAAKIFDRLDMAVLIEVALQIAPRKMSEILGLMQPEAAERLTVEMAKRASGDKSAAAVDLPKIEGRPASSN